MYMYVCTVSTDAWILDDYLLENLMLGKIYGRVSKV